MALSKHIDQVIESFPWRNLKPEKPLGSGGFGTVVQVKHGVDKQSYAVKICHLSHDTWKSCEREIEALSRHKLCEHNVIQYFDSWPTQIENEYFICIRMELCLCNLYEFVYDNQNFAGGVEIIKKCKLYRYVFPQILKGLKAMHEKKLMHRDLHYCNILVAQPNPIDASKVAIKITDFGLSRKTASNTTTLSNRIGYKYFRAPELHTSNYYDSKVDMYSAGILLYFLSRHIEDKTKWEDEIEALRKGERGPGHLAHQDDVTLQYMINSLIQIDNPHNRPTAEEALKQLETLSKNNTDNPIISLSNPSEKMFIYVQKTGEKDFLRISLQSQSFSHLKERIRDCVHIATEFMIHQKLKLNGVEERIRIESEESNEDMFRDAKKSGERIILVVSEAISPTGL